MLSIGGDDSAPIGDPARVRVTITCDGRSLLCADPIVVESRDVPPNLWPTEVVSGIARRRGWRLVDCDKIGRAWLCPSCRTK